MFRLRRWQRFASPVLALWFAVFIGESAWLNACPMHGGRSATSDASHAMHGASGHGDAHIAAAAVESDASKSPAPQQERAPCNCLGHCIGAAVHALATPPVQLQLVEWRTAVRVAATTASRPSERQEHRLPFATPPPTSFLAA